MLAAPGVDVAAAMPLVVAEPVDRALVLDAAVLAGKAEVTPTPVPVLVLIPPVAVLVLLVLLVPLLLLLLLDDPLYLSTMKLTISVPYLLKYCA